MNTITLPELSEGRVKVIVRKRDGKCVDCGISAAEYQKRTSVNKKLDVHRLVRNAPYTVEGCVTLCRTCHRRRHRKGGKESRLVRLWVSTADKIEFIAHAIGVSPAEYVDQVLQPAFEKDLPEAAAFEEMRQAILAGRILPDTPDA